MHRVNFKITLIVYKTPLFLLQFLLQYYLDILLFVKTLNRLD